MNRRADVLLTLGLVMMAAGASALFILPAVRARGALTDRIEQLRTELAKPNAGPEAIERLSRDRAALMQFGAGRMTPIPIESDVAGLMDSLTRTLSESGLDDRDITTRASRSLDGVSALPVTVAVTGSFPKIFEAMSRVESMPRLVRVERMRIQLEDDNPAKREREPRVRAELLIEVFYTPRHEAQAKIAGVAGGGAQ